MQHPVEITLRGVPPSAALERYIGEEAHKLERICDRLRSCQVLAEALRRDKRRGAPFTVRLVITLPGSEVVVNREHGDDIYIAVHDAFAAAGLQLQDYMRRLGTAGRRSRGGTPGAHG